MRYSIAPVAFAAVVAALPQGVTEQITPSTSAPAGCSGDYPGSFQIQVVNTTESDKRKRQDPASAGAVPLVLTLSGGILRDAQGRIGYIAANRQFQFDGPPQTGAIYTAGFSVCGDNELAIGDDKVFQQCLSGTFYNLYDEATEEQCSPVHIEAINGSGATGAQPAPSAAVSQIADGQPQSPSAVQQIPDGQLQAPTGSPVQQIPDGQIQQPTGSPVSQIPDGQIQAPTGSPVSQIPDGQIQAPTGSPVQQIPDGQVQAPTGSPVQQIPDGQVRAPVNGTVASPTVQPYTGAGSSVKASLVSFVAAVGAAVLFL